MTQPPHHDDPELRSLLDSIGLYRDSDVDSAEHRARAVVELARIRNRARSTTRITRRRIAWGTGFAAFTAAAVVAVATIVVGPGHPATRTPQPLAFSVPQPSTGVASHADYAASRSALLKLAQAASQATNPDGPHVVRIQRWTRGAAASSTELHLPPAPENLIHHVKGEVTACGAGQTGCVLDAVSRAFLTYDLPPALVADLWQMLAASATTVALGTTRDHLGRRAVGFGGRSRDSIQHQLLADPTTGAFLGIDTVITGGSDAPALQAYVAIETH